MKKNSFILVLFIFLLSMPLFSCGGANQEQEYRNQPGSQPLDRNAQLAQMARLDDLKLLLKDKIVTKQFEIFEPASAKKYREKYNKLYDDHQKKKKRAEENFRKRLEHLRDFFLELKEIRINLDGSKNKIADKVNQIKNLISLLEDKKKVEKNSVQIFRERLKLIPLYNIMVGKRELGAQAWKDVVEIIRENMEKYLNNQLLAPVIDATTIQGHSNVSVTEEISAFRDDWEYSVEQGGNIFMYQAFKIFPFYQKVNNISYHNIKDFRIKKGTSQKLAAGVDVQIIESESPDTIVQKMLDFFKTSKEPSFTARRTEKFKIVADHVTKNMRNSLEEIKKIAREFKQKAEAHQQSVDNINKEFESILHSLREVYYEKKAGLGKSITSLITLFNQFNGDERAFISPEELDRIKLDRDNLKELIDSILKQFNKEDQEGTQLQKINYHISNINTAIDKVIENSIKAEIKTLFRNRQDIILGLGKIPMDRGINRYKNFVKAVEAAYASILKKNQMKSFVDVMEIKHGQFIIRTADTYYKKGNIKNCDIPFLCERKKRGDEGWDTEYIVFVVATVFFDMRGIIVEKDGLVFDTGSGLVWTKDDATEKVVYESVSDTDVSVVRLLQEKQIQNANWRLVTEEDLKKIRENRELFGKLNLSQDRFYWSSETIGIYRQSYNIKEKDGILTLTPEGKIPSDGAFYIFVRPMERGEEDEL